MPDSSELETAGELNDVYGAQLICAGLKNHFSDSQERLLSCVDFCNRFKLYIQLRHELLSILNTGTSHQIETGYGLITVSLRKTSLALIADFHDYRALLTYHLEYGLWYMFVSLACCSSEFIEHVVADYDRKVYIVRTHFTPNQIAGRNDEKMIFSWDDLSRIHMMQVVTIVKSSAFNVPVVTVKDVEFSYDLGERKRAKKIMGASAIQVINVPPRKFQ